MQWIDVENHDFTEVGEPELAADIARRANKLFADVAAAPPGTYHDREFAELNGRLDDLIAMNKAAMFRADSRSVKLGKHLAYEFAGGLALVLLVGAAVSWGLGWRLSKPLTELTERLRGISQRKSQVRLGPQPLAELEAVAREFNQMAERLEQYDKLNVERLVYEKSKTEAIIESLEDGVVLIDREGIVAHINEIASLILGVDPQDALGSPFDDLSSNHPHYLRVRDALRTLQRAGPDGHRTEIDLHVRGRDHSYVLKPVPLHHTVGKSLGTLLILQDVTYIRDQDRARTNLVATLSHELRTPLTSLALSAELLSRENAPDRIRKSNELLQVILEECSRMRQLTDNLLNLARGEVPAIAVQQKRLDLARLAADVTKRFAIQAREKHVEIEEHIGIGARDYRRPGQALVGDFESARQRAALHSRRRNDQSRGARHRAGDAARSHRFGPRNSARDEGLHFRALRAVWFRGLRKRIGRAGPVDRQGNRRGPWRQDFRRERQLSRRPIHRRNSRRAGDLMAKLLIVDDERNIRRSLITFFESLGHEVRAAENGAQAVALLAETQFDLVLTDYKMAEMSGLELLREIKRRAPECLVILMTAYATVENAVEAMKSGAYDYVTKPFSLEQIQHTVDRALHVGVLTAENRALRSAIDEEPLLDSKSPAMQRLLETARQAAASDATILLTGESGTGKNVIARQIHRWSRRQSKPFVVVNCTTLSEELLESELFGHMRGAFTGAVKDKPGRLEAANGGTVFLDEIADLTPTLQTKFLRFLQDQNFERVGGERTIHVDARIIAASNRDLESEVAAHHFREDLYYRLNVITLRVPPLRERREDILPLAQWLLNVAAIRNSHPGLAFSPGATAALTRYRWPGNVRELRNAIERGTVLMRGETIAPDDLPDSLFHDVDRGARRHPQRRQPRRSRARAHRARARRQRHPRRSRRHARHQRHDAVAQAPPLRNRIASYLASSLREDRPHPE